MSRFIAKQNIFSSLITACIVFFIAWVSFIPEPLQVKTLPFVFIFLVIVILLSVFKHNFNFPDIFFKTDDFSLWLYFIFIATGLIAAVNKTIAWQSYIQTISLSALVYFIVRNEKGNLRTILFSFVFFSFLVSLIGILERLFSKNIIYIYFVESYFYPKFVVKGRIVSTLENPSILGTYLLVCLPLAYYFYRSASNMLKKYAYLFFLFTITIALLLTYSRAAIIAALIIFSFYLWYKHKRRWVVVIWGALFISSVGILFLPDFFKLKSRFGLTYIINHAFYSERAIQYFVTFNMLKEHPFVGIGWGHYRMLFNNYTSVRLPYLVMIPESSYLMYLAETGIIGFSFFIIFIINLVRKCLRYLFNKKAEAEFGFILMGFIGLLINMGSYDALLWRTPFYLFWIYAGMLSGLIIQNARDKI